MNEIFPCTKEKITMSVTDDDDEVRVVSFLRACDCLGVGIKVTVSSTFFPTFTDLLDELNGFWANRFPLHADSSFVYNVNGQQINSVSQLKVNVRSKYDI